VSTSRQRIVEEIKRVAGVEGRPPGIGVFTRLSGIPEHHWKGVHYAKWSDALADAGLQANSLNERLNSETILQVVAKLCVNTGSMPSKVQYKLHRRNNQTLPHDETLRQHFGSWAGLRAALRDLALRDAAFSSLLQIMPSAETSTHPAKPKAGGWVYLLQSGAHYKIGRSDTLERRIREISIALPERVELIHAIETDDPIGIETYWHRRYADRRMNGEWFNLSVDDVRAFRRRKFQ